MASPAEIANDMAMQAVFWRRRDKVISQACKDAAVVIRRYLTGERVDGRTYCGLHRRLLGLVDNRTNASFGIANNLSRALTTLQMLHATERR